MSTRKIELPSVELDLSEAVVEKADASVIDLEMKIRGVSVPGRRLSSVLLRFEGIKDFDEIWYQLTTKVRKRGKNKIHDPWPLKLPAALKTLVEVKSRSKLRKFQFAVDEEHFQGRKQPLEFSCKRFCVTDIKGNHVAGDESKITQARQWSEKAALRIADQFASAVESRDFRQAHRLLESRYAKLIPVAKLAERLERLMKGPRHLEVLQNELGIDQSFEHLPMEGYDPDLVPKGIDPDEVVAVVQTGFLGWFTIDLVLTEQKGELRIRSYQVDRDWETVFY